MKKVLVDLITAVFLIIMGCVVLVLPIMGVMNVKAVFITVLALYGIVNLVQFILTFKDKDLAFALEKILSVLADKSAIIVEDFNIEKILSH